MIVEVYLADSWWAFLASRNAVRYNHWLGTVDDFICHAKRGNYKFNEQNNMTSPFEMYSYTRYCMCTRTCAWARVASVCHTAYYSTLTSLQGDTHETRWKSNGPCTLYKWGPMPTRRSSSTSRRRKRPSEPFTTRPWACTTVWNWTSPSREIWPTTSLRFISPRVLSWSHRGCLSGWITGTRSLLLLVTVPMCVGTLELTNVQLIEWNTLRLHRYRHV